MFKRRIFGNIRKLCFFSYSFDVIRSRLIRFIYIDPRDLTYKYHLDIEIKYLLRNMIIMIYIYLNINYTSVYSYVKWIKVYMFRFDPDVWKFLHYFFIYRLCSVSLLYLVSPATIPRFNPVLRIRIREKTESGSFIHKKTPVFLIFSLYKLPKIQFCQNYFDFKCHKMFRFGKKMP